MLKSLLISTLLRQLTDKDTLNAIQEVIEFVGDQEATGEEKRIIAINEIKAKGVKASNWVINLALELLIARTRI